MAKNHMFIFENIAGVALPQVTVRFADTEEELQAIILEKDMALCRDGLGGAFPTSIHVAHYTKRAHLGYSGSDNHDYVFINAWGAVHTPAGSYQVKTL